MHFLLNIIFAILFGLIAMWAAKEMSIPRPVAVALSLAVAFLVYLADLASRAYL